LTQFVSPNDEHDVLETRKELRIRINTQNELYVTLVIYQESLHDARSTKYKIVQLRVVLLMQHDYCAQICSILNSVHSAKSYTENVNACYSTNTYLIKYLLIGAEDGTNKQ
jgi:hypothetical protein